MGKVMQLQQQTRLRSGWLLAFETHCHPLLEHSKINVNIFAKKLNVVYKILALEYNEVIAHIIIISDTESRR